MCSHEAAADIPIISNSAQKSMGVVGCVTGTVERCLKSEINENL